MNEGNAGIGLHNSFKVCCYTPHNLKDWQHAHREGRQPTLADLLGLGANLEWEEVFRNAWNTASLNDLLAVYFNAGTQKTTWFFGLVDNAGFTTFAAADTIASHTGWTESTAYTAGTRQAWTPSAPAGGSIINPTPQTLTMNASATIKGAFLVSDSTKGGTVGMMAAAGAFPSNQVVINGQVLSLQYQCPLTAL